MGGLIGGGMEAAKQIIEHGEISDWGAVGGSTLQGALTGAAAGFTGGTSLLVTSTASGVANAIGGAANRAIQGNQTTLSDVVTDAAVGVVGGAAGKIVGDKVSNITNKLSKYDKGNLGEAITRIKYGAKGYVDEGKAVVETGKKTATGINQVAKYDHKMSHIVTGKKLTVESKFNNGKLTPNQKTAQSRVSTPGGLIISNTTSKDLGSIVQAAFTGAIAGSGTQTNNKTP